MKPESKGGIGEPGFKLGSSDTSSRVNKAKINLKWEYESGIS